MAGDDRVGPDAYDHLRPVEGSDAPVDPGVYRVVGAGADEVALLRVADADGRRRHTGELHTVARADLDDLAPAENPDGNRSALAAARGALQGVAWSFRVLARAVATRPIPGALALGLLAIGFVGEELLGVPPGTETGAAVAAALVLVYLARTGPA